MPSQVDFAVAVGIFFTFVAILIVFLSNYIVSFTGIASTSELRTVAYDFYNSLFSSKGLPSNWQERILGPLKIGLVIDMYRVPVAVTETSNANRTRVGVNFSYVFDQACAKRAWNSTVRLYDTDGKSIDMQLYNQSYCTQRFLKSADVMLNDTFNAGEKKTFFIYFSSDKNISESNATVAFLNATQFNFRVYPEETLAAVSVEKLAALRRQNYTDVLNTLGKDYYFNIEVSDK